MPASCVWRITLGRHGAVATGTARRRAMAAISEAKGGGDLAARDERRKAMTMRQLGKRFLEEYVPNHCKPSTAYEDNPWVIAGKKAGSHLTDLQHPWRRIRARADLEDVRIHDLRHSFASRALALGEGLPMIGKLLGHTQVQTTARYAHLARDTVKASAARIGDGIDGDLKAVEWCGGRTHDTGPSRPSATARHGRRANFPFERAIEI